MERRRKSSSRRAHLSSSFLTRSACAAELDGPWAQPHRPRKDTTRTDSALLVRLIVVCSLATGTARGPERVWKRVCPFFPSPVHDVAGRSLSVVVERTRKEKHGPAPVAGLPDRRVSRK